MVFETMSEEGKGVDQVTRVGTEHFRQDNLCSCPEQDGVGPLGCVLKTNLARELFLCTRPTLQGLARLEFGFLEFGFPVIKRSLGEVQETWAVLATCCH